MVRAENSVGTFTLGDTILYTFSGMTVYEPAAGDPFTIPVIWLLMNLYLCLCGGQLSRTGSSRLWTADIAPFTAKRSMVGRKMPVESNKVLPYITPLGGLIMTVSSLILGGNMTLRITSELWKMLTWEGSEAERP